MDIRYVPGDSRIVQGKFDEVYRIYGKEWNIKPQGGGNGNWLLTKSSDVLVDGIRCRGFVLEHYDRTRLTPKLFDMFSEDLKKGKITKEQLTNS